MSDSVDARESQAASLTFAAKLKLWKLLIVPRGRTFLGNILFNDLLLNLKYQTVFEIFAKNQTAFFD